MKDKFVALQQDSATYSPEEEFDEEFRSALEDLRRFMDSDSELESDSESESDSDTEWYEAPEF